MTNIKQIGFGLVAGIAIGAVTLGTVGVSAAIEKGSKAKGVRQVTTNVLGLERSEVKDLKESGQSFEEIVVAQGFSSVDDFQSAVEVELRAYLQEQGLTEAEIDEKFEARALRQEVREDRKAVMEQLLGATKDELKAEGADKAAILEAAGFDSKDAFKEAVQAELESVWLEDGLSQDEIDSRLESSFKKGKRLGYRN